MADNGVVDAGSDWTGDKEDRMTHRSDSGMNVLHNHNMNGPDHNQRPSPTTIMDIPASEPSRHIDACQCSFIPLWKFMKMSGQYFTFHFADFIY